MRRTGSRIAVTRRNALLGLAAGAGALCALPAMARADAAWDAVVRAAKQEGSVVVYSAFVGLASHNAIKQDFEQKYGIKVRYLEARASEVRERIRIEQAAGRFTADVSENGSTTTSLQIMEDNVFASHGALPRLDRIAPDLRDNDAIRLPIFAIVYGILANTRLVTEADQPKSWLDLTDPRWKGKILSDDMRALGGGGVFFSVMQDHFGSDYHKRLATQDLQFGREIPANERRLARGEFALYIPESLTGLPQLKGLPVRFIAPREGLPYVVYDLALLKSAPHPNAARLFMNHCLSESVQQGFVNLGLKSATTDTLMQTNPIVAPYANVRLLGTTDPRRQNAMLALAKQDYH